MAMTPPPLLSEEEHLAGLRRRTYKAILELSARHPMLNSADIAVMTGATESWIRRIMKSDAFMSQRAQRIEDLHGPRLREIQAKMEETTSMLLDAVARRIANPDAAVTEETLLKATQMLLDRLPLKKDALMQPSPGVPGQVNQFVFNSVSPEDLARARQSALDRGSIVTLEPQVQRIAQRSQVDEDGLPKAPRVRSNEGLD